MYFLRAFFVIQLARSSIKKPVVNYILNLHEMRFNMRCELRYVQAKMLT